MHHHRTPTKAGMMTSTENDELAERFQHESERRASLAAAEQAMAFATDMLWYAISKEPGPNGVEVSLRAAAARCRRAQLVRADAYDDWLDALLGLDGAVRGALLPPASMIPWGETRVGRAAPLGRSRGTQHTSAADADYPEWDEDGAA